MTDDVDWDAWRSQYHTLTYEQHRAFNDHVGRTWPRQEHFDAELARLFLDTYQPATVIELGGWDGALAQQIGGNVESWTNYDITDRPQVCTHPGYRRVIPDGWAWQQPLQADAFVASHVLEHLSEQHLHELLDALDCQAAYVDVPLKDSPYQWRGYFGSHVLPLSMPQFEAAWQAHGWRVAERFRPVHGLSQVRFLQR